MTSPALPLSSKLSQLAMIDTHPKIIDVWVHKDGSLAAPLRDSLRFIQGFLNKLPDIIDSLKVNPPRIPGKGDLTISIDELDTAKMAAIQFSQRLTDPYLRLKELREITQASIFNAFKNLFSAQVQGISDLVIDGDEKAAFERLGTINTRSAADLQGLKDQKFSTAVIYGGYIGAMSSRTQAVLDFGARVENVGLLATSKRDRVPTQEPDAKFFDLDPNFTGELPTNEMGIFRFVWDAKTKALNSAMNVINADAATRADDQLKPPGTLDTVRALIQSSKLQGVSLGNSFLCASSDCYQLRQMLDLVVTFLQEGEPVHRVAVIGPNATNYKATTVYQEIAKTINCLYILAGYQV